MRNPHGDFIWYELPTNNPAAAKAFYDPVAGWNIDAAAAGDIDYRMIDTGDGAVGGTMTLTREMTEHGAKPTWLGYIGVDDVEATIADIEARGGKVLMPAYDMDGVGRIATVTDPQGNPFYVMRGASDETSTSFDPEKFGTPRGTSFRPATSTPPGSSTPPSSAGRSARSCRWAKWAIINSSTMAAG